MLDQSNSTSQVQPILIKDSNKNNHLRIPRQVKRFPRNPLKDPAQLSQILYEIRPYLLKAAYKISRPYYIDPEDLVQEALLKIYRNRDRFNGNMNASLKTWLVNVAIRHFYSIAVTEYRKKRVPQGMHLAKSFIDIGEMENLSQFKTTADIYAPHTNETEYFLRYKEIVRRTEMRLKPFAKKVFFALLEPPESLIEKIIETRDQRIENREMGISTKVPFQFAVTTKQLADYFNVPQFKITRAKNLINEAMQKAIED